MSAPSLYTLAQGFADLTALLERIDEEGLDEVSASMIADWLARLDGAVAGKLESVGKYLRMQELAADAIDTEIERLRARSVTARRRVSRIKAAVLFLLDTAQMQRVDTETFTFSIAGDGGKQPLVVDDVDPADVAAAHPDLVAVVQQINKPAVREALERGASLPFARLAPRGRHLRIR